MCMNRQSKLIYRIMLASKLHNRDKEISLDKLKQGCCLSDPELLAIIKELEIKKLISWDASKSAFLVST